jgi:hypothetical protein
MQLREDAGLPDITITIGRHVHRLFRSSRRGIDSVAVRLQLSWTAGGPEGGTGNGAAMARRRAVASLIIFVPQRIAQRVAQTGSSQ